MALIIEGPTLKEGVKTAIAKVGAQNFYTALLSVGLFYHLYNQVRSPLISLSLSLLLLLLLFLPVSVSVAIAGVPVDRSCSGNSARLLGHGTLA